jgi:Molybdopterin-binding domain of aldehyde dehydrogenase
VVVNPAAGPIRLRDFDTGPLGDVLRRGGQRSGWAQRHALPPRTAKGIAFYFSRAGCFAEVAQVTVPPSGDIKLDHVWIVADFGSQIINPSGAVNQVQGAALDVIGAALGQAITPERGRVVQSNSTAPGRCGSARCRRSMWSFSSATTRRPGSASRRCRRSCRRCATPSSPRPASASARRRSMRMSSKPAAPPHPSPRDAPVRARLSAGCCRQRVRRVALLLAAGLSARPAETLA